MPNNCVRENSLSSVVMVLAFGARGLWFESCPDLIFLPCIYSFVSLLRPLFVRCLTDRERKKGSEGGMKEDRMAGNGKNEEGER